MKNITRKRIKLGIFFLVALYIGLNPLGFYSRFEFLPEEYNATKYAVADKIPHEDVYIPVSNGKKIHAWYFPVPDSKHTIIVHHGQAHNIAFFFPVAQLFHNCGASVLSYDYEGYGRSDGPTAHEALRRDSEAAHKFIRDVKKVPENQIVHCGISMGTGAACDVAARQKCAGVFLCSPYWSTTAIANSFVPISRLYPRFAFPQPDFGAADLVTKNVPILIVHGDNDPIIPLWQAQKIYDLAVGPKELFIVKNGFHVGSLAPGIEEFCTNWLNSLPTELKY
ncbi:alpha/beta fold hydrolase [Candidatus Obscuribacterales bacterium]|nr:alpha/beta fold hydrolase [Candidatus Obscuribacterales bacterium]